MKRPKPSLGGKFPTDMWERIGARLEALNSRPEGSFTLREFMEKMNVRSESTGRRRLDSLAEKGFIKKTMIGTMAFYREVK